VRFYPYDPEIVDWSIALDDQHRYMPQGYSFLDGTRLAETLSQSEIAFVTRWEVTNFFRVNHIGEHLLNQAILALLHRTDVYDPAFRYLLHEVAEECQHMSMFNSWVRLNDDIRTKGAGSHIWGIPASVLTPIIASRAPALFWVLTFVFEEFGDDFSRVAARNADGNLHPIIVMIGRTHMVEEARHIAFAKDWLNHQLPRMSRAQRMLLSTTVERILAGAIRLGLPLRYGRQLAEYVSYEAFRDAMHSDHRRRLFQNIYRDLVVDLNAMGIVRDRTLNTWRRTALLSDAA